MTTKLHNPIAADIEGGLTRAHLSIQDLTKGVDELLGGMSIDRWDASGTNTPLADFVKLSAERHSMLFLRPLARQVRGIFLHPLAEPRR